MAPSKGLESSWEKVWKRKMSCSRQWKGHSEKDVQCVKGKSVGIQRTTKEKNEYQVKRLNWIFVLICFGLGVQWHYGTSFYGAKEQNSPQGERASFTNSLCRPGLTRKAHGNCYLSVQKLDEGQSQGRGLGTESMWQRILWALRAANVS